MKIGIDISQVAFGTGVSRYTQELVEQLISIDKTNQYVLFFSSLRQKIPNSPGLAKAMPKAGKFQSASWRKNKNLKFKNFKFPPSFLEVLWNRLHVLNIERFIGKTDVFHSSDWIQPPSKSKKVTTVHDVSFLRYPESFPQKIINVHKRRLTWVKKDCDIVIVDSETTKRDLVDLLNFDEKKIRVIYLGVNSKFKINPSVTPGEKLQSEIQNIKNKYKIADDYILSLGTQEPRKNLKRIIEAFNIAIKQDNNKAIQLVLVGKKGWGEEGKQLTINNQQSNIIFTGFVPDEELPYIYAGAKCFVYPSLYEGFGLPVLEAMAAGCPVITSNISSLPEIAGKAAILVDPLKVNDLADSIHRILSNKSLTKKLVGRGRKQADGFTWEKTARATLGVYESLICK